MKITFTEKGKKIARSVYGVLLSCILSLALVALCSFYIVANALQGKSIIVLMIFGGVLFWAVISNALFGYYK